MNTKMNKDEIGRSRKYCKANKSEFEESPNMLPITSVKTPNQIIQWILCLLDRASSW